MLILRYVLDLYLEFRREVWNSGISWEVMAIWGIFKAMRQNQTTNRMNEDKEDEGKGLSSVEFQHQELRRGGTIKGEN